MDALVYHLARAVLAFLQTLPLRWVARLGRVGGALAWLLDRRHRRVALRNLTLCFGQERSASEIRALAKENFRRIGENFACAAKTAGMSFQKLSEHFYFQGESKLMPGGDALRQRKVVGAIGHFGNFELYARIGQLAPEYKFATTYRALRQPRMNELLQTLRNRSGCRFFERRFEAAALKAFMRQPGVMLGLLADQHAGTHGILLPFLGHECATSPAPALFALRYGCDLHTAICYRERLARWRIEIGDQIPTHENGRPRSTRDIMLDVNRAFDVAVRRDPANWFWVHNRWKALGRSAKN